MLGGKKLLLTDDTEKPQKRKLSLVSKDPAISLGAGNGSADDPTLVGGTLRVVASGGDGVDATYDLPSSAWKLVGKEGAGKGYALKKAMPIKSIVVKPGKQIKITGKGADLNQSLASDPETVSVVLSLGELRYCFTFGGTAEFKPGKKYLAKDAPAPVVCPAAASSVDSPPRDF